ncbi:MAG: riboflavin biosynthesis protein RibF [Muribaculaceae bacterium]
MALSGVIATIGMFDGVHRGHIHLLQQLRREGASRSLAPVAVTFESHPLRVIAPERAPRVLMSLPERVEALRRPGVDVVVLDFASVRRLTAADFMRLLAADYGVKALLMGFNHNFGSDRLSTFDDYRRAGEAAHVEVLQCTEVEGLRVSSSMVRRAVAAGDMAQARAMLGRYYSISGTVVSGHHLGRTINFPTANMAPDVAEQLLPADGVYACIATVEGYDTPLTAMTNIGCRPTVATHGERTIEAHIIGLDADIYGCHLRLAFVERLRGEMQFADIAALQRQLTLDREATLRVITAASAT